jgi:hypothetical protein
MTAPPRCLLTGLLLLTAGASGCRSIDRFPYERVVLIELGSAPTAEPRHLIVDVPLGRVELIGDETSEVAIECEVRLRAAEEHLLEVLEPDCGLEAEMQDDRYVVRAPRLPDDLPGRATVSYRLNVRAGKHMTLDIHSAVGSIDARGFESDVELETSTGSLTLADSAGSARLHTSTGSIRLLGHRGTADCTTSTGSVEAEFRAVEGDGPMRFITSTGSVKLVLPSDINARVTGRTSTGSVRCDPPLVRSGRSGRRRIEGVLGNGGRSIEARTSTGSVTIRLR